MAKFMLLGGSPRKNGNTEKMLDIFQAAMAEQLPGVVFVRYFLEDMHIQMCRACLTCFRTEGPTVSACAHFWISRTGAS